MWPPRRESRVEFPVEIVGRPESGEERTPRGSVEVCCVIVGDWEGGGASVEGVEEVEVLGVREGRGVKRLRKDMVKKRNI